MFFSGTTFNSRATYTCDRGFVLSGQSVRTCQSDGEWSGRAPECKSKYVLTCTVVQFSISVLFTYYH